MAANPPDKHIALFVDWENLRWRLQHKHKLLPEVEDLLHATDRYGTLNTARAYADWTLKTLENDSRAFRGMGVEPVQVPGRLTSRGEVMRSGTDVRLAADAVETCFLKPELSTFVLVTGDSDLSPVLSVLKRQGRHTIVLGVMGALNNVAAADEVLYYDHDVISLTPEEPEAVIMNAKTSLETAFGWVEALLRQSKGKGLTLGNLENVMTHLHGFNARSFGLSFGEFMEALQESGRVKVSSLEGALYASIPLKDEPPAPEITWLLDILRENEGLQPLNDIIKELRARHELGPHKDLQESIQRAQRSGLVALSKNKGDGQWYIKMGD